MTTATVSVWRDCGYTEGALEVPSKTSTLPTVTYTFSGLNIPRSDLFSKVTVKAPYEDLYDCSYLKVQYDMNNGDDVTVFGWIDSVECSSDTANSPATIIRWHIDYWRTYAFSATYKAGMVKRRPFTSQVTTPPQQYPMQYFTSSIVNPIVTNTNTWWVIFTMVASGTIPVFSQITFSAVACFPINISSTDYSFNVSGTDATGSETITKKSPSMNMVVSGWFDEIVGLDPNAISSCFLSPIPPDDFGTSSTKSSSGWSVWHSSKDVYSDYGCLIRVDYKPTSEVTIAQAVQTIDTVTYGITDFNGQLVGTLPWGLAVTSWKSRLIIDATSSYIEIRANGIDGTSMGETFTIPLIPISVTSNSTSTYVYSGARDADIANRRDQLVMSAFGGLSKVGRGTVESTIAPAVGSSLSLAGGAALGGAGIGLNVAMGALSNELAQTAKDRSVANQTQHFVMSGTGWDVVKYGRLPSIVRMEMDAYSQTQREKDIQLYGITVAEPTADCTTLINAGGPLQITNLNVTGSIPVEAKQYLRSRFASGVRMI